VRHRGWRKSCAQCWERVTAAISTLTTARNGVEVGGKGTAQQQNCARLHAAPARSTCAGGMRSMAQLEHSMCGSWDAVCVVIRMSLKAVQPHGRVRFPRRMPTVCRGCGLCMRQLMHTLSVQAVWAAQCQLELRAAVRTAHCPHALRGDCYTQTRSLTTRLALPTRALHIRGPNSQVVMVGVRPGLGVVSAST
jgi:hypothetical protein